MRHLIGLIAVLAAVSIYAPSITVAQEQTAGTPLTREDKSQAIAAFIKDLKDNYVFPELADKTSEILKRHLDQGDYEALTTGRDFATTVSGQVHDICQDAHLRFLYSPEVLPVRKLDSRPSPEEDKAYAHFVHLTNSGFEHVERLDGNIGYLEVRGFPDAASAKALSAAAMTFLANTDALILDLRRNGGGDPEAVKILLSYFFEKRTHLNDIYFRDGNRTQEFWTTARVPGKKYLNKDVYVLTSSRTGSGGEECAYDLQCLRRATLIGTKTWGGANPGGIYRLSDHFSAFIPSGRAINPYTKKNWEGTGVIPDVKVDADKALDVAKKMALEKLMTTANKDDKEDLQRALDALTHPMN
jgi:retinol-binding protein 3